MLAWLLPLLFTLTAASSAGVLLSSLKRAMRSYRRIGREMTMLNMGLAAPPAVAAPKMHPPRVQTMRPNRRSSAIGRALNGPALLRALPAAA